MIVAELEVQDMPTETDVPSGKPKKKRGKIGKVGKRIVALAVVAGLIAGGIFVKRRFFPAAESEGSVLTDFVYYGSVTSKVEGGGVILPKNSESIALRTGGTVREVYVQEGDYVTAGTPLYALDSTELDEQITKAEKTVSNYQKEVDSLYAAIVELDIRAPHAGVLRITDDQELMLDDSVVKGQRIATLVDDSHMLLSQYFSYTYENDISEGQEASISVPSAMARIPATVQEIRKVKRVSNEGSLLFEVVFRADNPGTLAEGMTASAELVSPVSGEKIYPYEAGALKYGHTTNITAKVSGTVEETYLMNYAAVEEGELLVRLNGEENDVEIATKENQLDAAKKELDELLATRTSLNASATIDGTVLSIGVRVGEEMSSGSVAVSIADTQTMVVKANVDERNISHLQTGTMVDISQYGTPMSMGIVTSVSLTGSYENGVSTFPIEISVDNPNGMIMSGSYIDYSVIASQSDNCLVVPLQCIKYVETDAGSQTVLFVRGEPDPDEALQLKNEITDIPEGFYPVAVEIGISDNYNVEILSGVEEGTEVFTAMDMSMSGGMMW